MQILGNVRHVFGCLWASRLLRRGFSLIPILLVLGTPMVQAQFSAFPIADIQPGSGSSSPIEFVELGSFVVFRAATSSTGQELWRTDGTAGGTYMIKNIRPGVASGSPQEFVKLGSILVFRANNGTHGSEIWRTDGTSGGTYMIKDINTSGSGSSLPDDLILFNGAVYFSADDATNGRELWKTGGTSGTTVMVKDIWSGSGYGSPDQLMIHNGSLYFAADGGGTGAELWTSDGTGPGTVLVKEIQAGSEGSYPDQFSSANGLLYFSGYTTATRREPYRSDGTSSGTYELKDIMPAPQNHSFPGKFTAIGSQVFFVASDNVIGSELWVTDGTSLGTSSVKDIYPGIIGGIGASPFLDVGGLLLTVARDNTSGYELWISNGTSFGTFRLEDLNPGTGDGAGSELFKFNGSILFAGNDGTTGLEIWSTDGSSAAVLVQELESGSTGSDPGGFTSIGGRVYFSAEPTATGDEPWILLEGALDFGDADDPTYPTLLASDGARHTIDPAMFMGSAIDFEPDGQPSPNADLDDYTNIDDEDGVLFSGPVVIGSSFDFDLIASQAGLVNAWIDLNLDGDWADAGEQIMVDEAVTGGSNPFVIPIPGTATNGVTTARFRFDSSGGLSYDGAAADGEVEDHLIVLSILDFGDAPDPSYPTLLASDGARHVVGTLRLGLLLDGETDGQPSAGADGDDTSGVDDEDGIVFTTQLVPGLSASADVTVTCVVEGSCEGYVNVWIDFNQDGDWDDAGEHPIVDDFRGQGTHSLGFDVPPGATAGVTIGRVRLSSGSGLSTTGYADDGEVEDFQVNVEVGGADLSVSIVASLSVVLPGDDLSYTVSVANAGPVTATSVELTTTLDSELTFLSSTPGAPDCTESSGVVTCDLGSIDSGNGTVVSVLVNVPGGATGPITSTSTVTATEPDPNGSNNTDEATTTVDLELIFVDGFETGDTTRWDLTTP